MPSEFFGWELRGEIEGDQQSALVDALEVMRPKSTCFPLIRIGGDRDGAYLLPDDLTGVEACFSPGVNNFKTFEDQLAKQYGIASHMCDFTSDVESFRTPLLEGLQTFEKKWLDVEGTPDGITLEDWVARRAPGDSDLILQMDIEGAEYRNILSCPRGVLQRFRIIVLELHALNKLADPFVLYGALKPFFDTLNQDFVCVHAHPNNSLPPTVLTPSEIEVPPLLELTLLRRDRLDPNAEQLSIRLPHPLDIKLNVQTRPPLFLDDWWRRRAADAAEVAYMLAAQNSYLRQNLSELQRAVGSFEVWQTMMTEAFTSQSIDALKGEHDFEPNWSALEEVANGKPYTLSSSRRPDQSTGVVCMEVPFFFHTRHEKRPEISIDLGEAHTIEWMRIGNRTDTGQERARGLFVRFGLPEMCDGLLLPLITPDSFFSRNPKPCLLRLNGRPARYVTIIGTGNAPLHLSEIALFVQSK